MNERAAKGPGWDGDVSVARVGHRPSLCSICVVTYRRPSLLEKLLESLESQDVPQGVDTEVIVVDNDAERSAEPVTLRFQAAHPGNVHYLCESTKNISLARNLAVRKAAGDYILFIDDDQVASRNWLKHMLGTIEVYGADGVFGPVVPEFHPATPVWMRRPEFFSLPLLETGERARFRGTGNCMLKARLLKALDNPFDPSYGLTGGEDTHLFDRLERHDAHFIYCREAWASEFVPPSRTRLSYLFRLGFKGGNTHTRRTIEAAGRYKALVRLHMLGKGLTYGATSLIAMVVHSPFPARRARWLMKSASNIGRLAAAFGWYYKAYR